MELLALIAGVLLILYVVGKLGGDPDPSKQGDEWLMHRLESEIAWVRRYRRLLIDHQRQPSESLEKSYQRRTAYIEQIENEMKLRRMGRAAAVEFKKEIQATTRAIAAIVESENVREEDATSIFVKRAEDDKEHARQEALKRELDAKAFRERFEATVQFHRSKGYNQVQAENRAEQQIARELAAEKGNPDAQFETAFFEAQQGREAEAVSWYWKAANQGHVQATEILYGQYRKHVSIPQRWLLIELLARAGKPAHQHNLAMKFYRDGEFQQAFHWLELAASKKGVSGSDYQRSAQYFLATLYSEGKGGAKNGEMVKIYF